MGFSPAGWLGVVRKGELKCQGQLHEYLIGLLLIHRSRHMLSTRKKELNKPRQPQGLRV
jgi:hypothetical protein